MGCCVPVLGPIENYYTKPQIDRMIDEIESAITSGCCITPEEVDEKIEEAISGITVSGVTEEQMNQAITSAMTIVEGEIPSLDGYATEQWVENKGYITGVDLSDYATLEDIPDLTDYALKSEIPSLSGYATEQWVENQGYITGVDLSDYVTYESLPDLTSYATKQWVINQNYVVNSELIQYITNLQQQIDSLKQQISGCCGDTGETLTRWITMTGVNDYTCSGTTKMTKEKEQTSSDGGNTWTDTGNYRTGSTVLETNSVDCGFVPSLKYTATYTDSSVSTANCDGNSTIVIGEITKTNLQSVSVGNCVSTIDSCVFCDIETLTGVNISSSVTTINESAFLGCHHLSSVTFDSNSLLETIGRKAFYGCDMTSITLPSSVTEIGYYALCENYNIQSITIYATTPPTLGYHPFTDTNNCPIYVPAASVNAYKAAWTDYASRIQAIP